MSWNLSLRLDDLESFEIDAFRRAWIIFRDEGVSVVKCPRCGDVIRFSWSKSDTVVNFLCPCGRISGAAPTALTDAQVMKFLMFLARFGEKKTTKAELFPKRTETPK